MRSVPISVFKAKCLQMVEEVRRTGESIQVTKRGKTVAVVSPPAKPDVDWTPGAFKSQTKILGDLDVELIDLGIEWEAMN